MNKKGFTLVETLIVSTVVAGILVYLFLQFSTVKRNFNTSFRYNTVNGLYALEDISEYINSLDTEFKNNYIINSIDNIGYINIYTLNDKYEDNVDSYEIILGIDGEDLLDSLNIDNLIITFEDLSDIDKSTFNKGITKFIDRINYDGGSNYRLIAKFKDDTYANLVFRLEGLDE